MRSLRVWRRFYDRVCPGPEAVDLAFKMRCSGWEKAEKSCFHKEKQSLGHAVGYVRSERTPHGWSSPHQERGAAAKGEVLGSGPERAPYATKQTKESRNTTEDRNGGRGQEDGRGPAAGAGAVRAPEEVKKPFEIEIETTSVAKPETKVAGRQTAQNAQPRTATTPRSLSEPGGTEEACARERQGGDRRLRPARGSHWGRIAPGSAAPVRIRWPRDVGRGTTPARSQAVRPVATCTN